MSNQNHDHKTAFQLERIALFSDAVFAIAITLLVIEIKVPNLPSTLHEFNEEFPHAMGHMMGEFIGFFISFIVIGNYWRAHHAIFGFVTDYDRKLISINSFLLLTIVIMPFTTAFMSKYMELQPFLIYCINVIASGLLQLWLWRYIVNPKNALSHNVPIGIRRYKTVTPLVVVICFIASYFVHLISNGFYARIILIGIFIVNIFVNKHFRKKYKLGKHI
jgi:uncharacterized membrane protein